ncbi:MULTISPECIES: diguanylate cyclase [unclassified Burkholderia]|uniref:diguanylate cyclase n=1 Tax=unclassified Burkholderia TaxID=2613784 RepID=UPI001E282A47|nr:MULTISPECIES: diguanylate cyclase [unclassified Burkholderia]UEP33131.1 diguanylate cyclase [Burkholderia sp. B21-007]UEP45808.1 diguanylate cyclase [Burkholderia sp. B21-005]
MVLFDTLREQMDSVRMPLFAVTVTAAAQVNTPLFAILHWHGFRRATPLVLPGVEIPPRPVPGSALQIDTPWHSVEIVDAMLLDAAWQSGAWDVERVERRGCNVIGASAAEALACRQAFGDYGENAAHSPQLLADETDRDELIQLAARRGYVRWLFRPVKGGLWRTLDEPDDTLDADGGRQPPCPVLPEPRRPDGRGRTVYRLGTVHRILLPR